jgi:signal transduction histidine kinase
MDRPPGPNDAIADVEIAGRLQWLLRLRWLIVPAFVTVDLANDLLMRRRAPWTALVMGGLLLAANGFYALLLHRTKEGAVHRLRAASDALERARVLASGVAHEINNPTAFVTSNLTELRRYVAAYEAAIADLAELAMQTGQAERARGLLARADVAFARREAGVAVSESLQGMERIHQIVTSLRPVARRDLAGEPASPPTTSAPPPRTGGADSAGGWQGTRARSPW